MFDVQLLSNHNKWLFIIERQSFNYLELLIKQLLQFHSWAGQP